MRQFSGKRIKQIEIAPEMGIGDPFEFFGILPDSVLTTELMGKLVDGLWSTGKVYRLGVYAEPLNGGVKIIVKIKPRKYLHRVSFSGNKHVKSEELREAIEFKPDMEISDDTVSRMKMLLRERYFMRGFPYASVDVEVKDADEPYKVVFNFKVSEGPGVRVADVNYEGSLILSPLELIKLTGIKRGVRYDKFEIDEGLEKLTGELKKRGYYNCRVRQPVVVQKDLQNYSLRIRIDSGPRFRVVFNGNEHVSSSRLMELIALEETSEIGYATLDEASSIIKEYYTKLGFPFVSLSYFISVSGDKRDGNVVFNIDEGDRIEVKEIIFRGNRFFSSKVLRKQIYSRLFEMIDYKLLFDTPSFEVVNELGIGGRMAKPFRSFMPAVRPLAVWSPKKIYYREAYIEGSKGIEALYNANGFLNVKVSKPAIKIDHKSNSMRVIITIDEGIRTWIDKVVFKGASSVDVKKLLELVKIFPGQSFNAIAVKEAEDRIVKYYYQSGFRFAEVNSDVTISEDGASALIVFEVKEGPLVRVSEVVVSGNEETKRSLVLDRVALKKGDVFTLDKEKKSIRYLRELNIFDSVIVSMEAPSVVSSQKRAAIELVEKKSQFLELRAGASSGEGLRGGMEYGYSNIFGYALNFGFILDLNYRFFFVGTGRYFPQWYREELTLAQQLERNIAVRFGIPHLPKIGKWVDIQTSFSHKRKNSHLYGVTKNSLYGDFIFKPISGLHFAVRVGFEDSNVGTNTVAERALSIQIQDMQPCSEQVKEDCLSPEERRELRVPVGKSSFTIVGGDFSLDLRDNAFDPRSGLRLSMGVMWIRSLGPAKMVHRVYASNDASKSWNSWIFSNLLRNTVSISGYIPLGTKKVVLMLYAAIGYIIQLQDGSQTFADRLFYLGGGHTMRGFPEEALCAYESRFYDTNDVKACIYGGSLMVNYKIELKFPIYKQLGIAVFSDIGNLWRNPQKNFNPLNVRATIGAGLRYSTPIGPLNLDYGFILMRDKGRGEPVGALHFSIGTF